jgi:hypothetical protein
VPGGRKARIEDVHELALAMPHVTVYPGTAERPVYQVGGRSFVFFRNPRPDAVDPQTGERYADVIVFWVGAEEDKIALVQDETTPFFTTPHFNGHLSVLLRGSRVGELTRDRGGAGRLAGARVEAARRRLAVVSPGNPRLTATVSRTCVGRAPAGVRTRGLALTNSRTRADELADSG